MTSVRGSSTASAGMAAGAPRRLRASDTDRVDVVVRLQNAVGEGRLTMEEGDARIAAAFATRYVDELQPLMRDLPEVEPTGPTIPGWRQIGVSVVTQLRYQLGTMASSVD